MNWPFRFFLLLFLHLVLIFPAQAQTERSLDDLLDMSLSELAEIEVTAGSHFSEPLFGVAGQVSVLKSAVVTVIGEDEIVRTGEWHLPELLRGAGGLQSARLNANRWSATSRIFMEGLPKTMMLNIDGRNTVSPLTSMINWDEMPVFLDDVESVEVLHGSGAYAWGAFAANGLLHVQSKDPDDTLGTSIFAGYDTSDGWLGSIRYGHLLGEGISHRMRLTYHDQGSFDSSSAEVLDYSDAWTLFRLDGRLDYVAPSGLEIDTFYGLFDGEVDETISYPVLRPPFELFATQAAELSGGHLSSRAVYSLDGGQSFGGQATYTRTERDSIQYGTERDILSGNAWYKLESDANPHKLRLGLSFQDVDESLQPGIAVDFNPRERSYGSLGANAVYRWELMEGLTGTLGSAFVDHDLSGAEWLPSARLSYTATDQLNMWGAVSRTVRSISRAEADVSNLVAAFPGESGLTGIYIEGDSSFEPEETISYEAGLRLRNDEQKWRLDNVFYYESFDEFQDFGAGQPRPESDPVAHLRIPVVVQNNVDGEVMGFDTKLDWEQNDLITWRAHYSAREYALRNTNGSGRQLEDSGESPRRQFMLRGDLNLSPTLSFGAQYNYVHELVATEIDAYDQIDAVLSWRATERVFLQCGGRNLLEDDVAEFGTKSTGGIQIGDHPRSWFFNTRINF